MMKIWRWEKAKCSSARHILILAAWVLLQTVKWCDFTLTIIFVLLHLIAHTCRFTGLLFRLVKLSPKNKKWVTFCEVGLLERPHLSKIWINFSLMQFPDLK